MKPTPRWLTPLFIAGVAGILLGSCAAPPARNGDNVAQINAAPLAGANTSLLQGYVSQTRVNNAKVWIDRASSTGAYNNTLDFGETSGTTSANGLFSLTQNSLDESNNYRIVTLGGTARSVSAFAESVGVMLAPRGATNVTPLTTMVALNNELADKIGQTLSSGIGSYSAKYDVDIAKSGGTFGEHLQLAKGIETFMYVLGRSNPDLPIISSTKGHIEALQILANRLNELDAASIYNPTSISSKIGAAATEVLNSSTIDSLVLLGTTERATISTQIESAAASVMKAVSKGTGVKQTEASVIAACSSAFASSPLVSDKTLSNTASTLEPVASSVIFADNESIVVYNSDTDDFTVDNDQNFDKITVAMTVGLTSGQSINIDNITFEISHTDPFGTVMTEKYRADNVTFSKNSSGNVAISINNPNACNITTSGNSFILAYDNVTLAPCNTALSPAGSTVKSLVDNSLGGGAPAAANLYPGVGTFKVSLLDSTSDNLSKSFEFNLTD
jgi:hypothetical protein